jgi:hypothetical protein
MKTQIIQLDNHDDLISARDKMTWSKAPRILLIWPKKGKLLERTVDLLVLQRYGHTLGAQVGVVSGNAQILGWARELGIPYFHNVTQAQKKVWRRSRGRKRLNLHFLDRKPAVAGLREQFGLITAGRNVVPENNWIRVATFSLGVTAVFALALIFWPSAKVSLSPVQREQQLELDFRASPDIPTANASGGLPAVAYTVVVEGSDQERSSGNVAVPSEQARGMVEISNLGDSPLIIPAGTVLTTTGTNPIRFETMREARIAAGMSSKADVEVRAIIPGTGGNTPEGSIRALEGNLGPLVSVDNPKAIGGGSDLFTPGPTENDYARLRERLIDSLHRTAMEDLRRNSGEDQRLLDGTVVVVEVLSENMSPPAGHPGDIARLSMQVEFSAWFVQEEDLQTIARAAFEANQVAGYIPDGNPIKIDFLNQPEVEANNRITWRASVKRSLQAVVDPERSARVVAGMTPENAITLLGNTYLLDEPVQIQLSPKWWFRMPFLSFRISVEEE